MKTVAEVAEILGADVDGDPSVLLRRLHPIGSAEEGDLTYIAKERHPPPPEELKASAAILHQGVDRDRLPARLTLLRMENPDLGFARAISLFFPPPDHPFEGISPAAHIDRSVELGEGVRIAPGAFVGAGTRLADRVVLYPGVTVGCGCELGEDVVLHPQVTLYAGCRIGARTVIHAGAVIGADGFGYAPDPDGAVKVPHRGGVRIEEDVEIGANTTIDRAVLNDTVIGRGSKIDNLVMIGHNNIVGPHCMMAGQVGIAGSCRIGAGVLIGGQAGLGGHLRVGDGAQIGGKSGVHRDIPPGERVLGIPATDVATARRAYAMLYRLPEVRRHIDRVSKRLEELLPPEDE